MKRRSYTPPERRQQIKQIGFHIKYWFVTERKTVENVFKFLSEFQPRIHSVLCSVRLSMKAESREKITFSFNKIFKRLPAMSPFSRGYCWPSSTAVSEWLWQEDLGPGSRRGAKGMASGSKGRPRELRPEGPGGLSPGEPGLQRWAERREPMQHLIEMHVTGLWKKAKQKIVQEEKCNCSILFGSAANKKQ